MKKMMIAALVIASMLAACGKKSTAPAKPTPGSAAPMEGGSGSAAPTEGGSGEAPPPAAGG
jgi:hypothetical protein